MFLLASLISQLLQNFNYERTFFKVNAKEGNISNI